MKSSKFWFLVVTLRVVSTLPLSVARPKIPITIISGFLGSGKTTLLQHMLHNKEGRRIAVIVNDVASVNVDSKLVTSSAKGAAGIVELQNGCACCSLSDELLGSVQELVTMSDIREENDAFQHIVIELSGVADPKSVRAKFQEAELFDMALMTRVCLDTMVTVVDCSVFLEHLASAKYINPNDTPELFYSDGEERPEEEDWMKDMPKPLMEALLAGRFNTMETSNSAVADLLVSQTEISDVLLLNKQDLVEKTVTDRVGHICHALNPRASIICTEYGKVPLDTVLGAAGGMGVVLAGVVDDHKDAVEAALHPVDTQNPEFSDASSHSHSHSHACDRPGCTDESHYHSHAQTCTDPSHRHPKHNEIGTYVYRARRPFHPKRLVSFLGNLPVKRGVPDQSEGDPLELTPNCKATLKKVIRSKGFVWCADSHQKALYWSHSGSSFSMECLGSWWATLPRDQWPEEAVSTLLVDFDDRNHDESDTSATTVGDRRQELVLIGTGIGEATARADICSGLDQCLLTDSEWAKYQSIRSDEHKLSSLFASPIIPQMVSL